MQTSIFLAQLIGPIFVVLGVGMLAQPTGYRAMAEEFLASPALIYLSGLLVLVPGLAIVLTHNVWSFDWRLIVTLLGWLATISGIFRLLMPGQVRRFGTAALARRGWLRGSGVVMVALGAVLSSFGYLA
jgi:uncharacterized protein YjeT (DUF2065 family)